MKLTEKLLQELFSICFFGDKEQKHLDLILSKQGNLLNPQTDGVTPTFFTFYIDKVRRKLMGSAIQDEHSVTLEYFVLVQCIGFHADEIMLDTLLWDDRKDIRQAMDAYDCQLMDNAREIFAVPWEQDGGNTIFAYATRLQIINTMSVTEATPSTALDDGLMLKGKLEIKE